MKRYQFELKNDQKHRIATVVMETDSVTVSEKEATSKTLGRPKRIPASLCAGGVEAQFQRSCLELKANGFILVNQEDSDGQEGAKPIVFAVIQEEQAAKELLKQLATSPLRQQNGFSARSTTELGSAHSALMILMAQKGIAKMYDGNLSNNAAMDASAVSAAAKALPPELYEAIVQQGFIEPGVVRSEDSRMTAILF
ncbi:hypothetical protein [Metallibacterium scheffleri]|uniref:Uncharacterized protein n=1 Tax=Metallibacterium scheffleri TaxID=993689 RepID=A0A4S3KRE6_9GAMM|nr:hypothetical protein [Metallibacterium scheffleri]THD11653.1 hypothetical protein B1806_02655 [Metallibacterium scheffleri]